MKRILLLFAFIGCFQISFATIHEIRVWSGYYQFLPNQLVIEIGDTIQWLPFDSPLMVHTVTSTNIPAGATSFDEIWQMPADTFFQYVPIELGLYEYECTPHAVSFGMIGAFTVYPSTGVPETNIKPVYVSPNPSSKYIEIFNRPENVEYRVIDITGKIVAKESRDSRLNITGFKEGLYFIELLFEKPRYIKFIKE
jgi:plastocyanin